VTVTGLIFDEASDRWQLGLSTEEGDGS